MTSVFDVLEAAASAAVDGAFAEVALHTPRLSAQYADRLADPNRPASSVRGVFSAGQAGDQLRGQARGAEFVGTTRTASMSAEFWISEAERAAMASPIAVGDTITLAARADSSVYAVSRIDKSDRNDINLILVVED